MRNPPPEHTRFKKGESGNPKGRPKIAENIKELKALIVAWNNETDAKGKSNIEKQIAKLAKSERGLKLLWEYGYGKVQQEIDITSKGEAIRIVGIDTSKV